jgi:Bax protein
MLNLNRHRSYKDFRTLRSHQRAIHKPFTGLEAATTMTNYSQMREGYNKLIANVIRGNGFMGYETVFVKKTELLR